MTSADDQPRARFEQLVDDVYLPLLRYLRRRTDPATADDVLGDVLLVLWRRLPDVPTEHELAWCYGVARGCLRNARRGAIRQQRLVQRLAAEPPTATRAPDADPELGAALAALPLRDQEVLHLWAWEDLPPRDIATVLGISPNAASIRLHRAVRRLRQQLSGRKERSLPGHSLSPTETEAPQ